MQDKYDHELQTGAEYEPRESVVSPDVNQQFLYAVEDFNPAGRIGRNSGYAVGMTGRLLVDASNLRLDSHLDAVAAWQSLAHTTPEHGTAVSQAFQKSGARHEQRGSKNEP